MTLVDLTNPPLGFPVEQVRDLAKQLGLPDLPTVLGAGCDTPQPTNQVDGVHPYPHPGSGPVILRKGANSSTQQYCINSVSVLVPSTQMLTVVGSDCHLQANPIVVP
ncbi:hypothetical protein [Streptomyces sp. NBC_01408]|uniref:hypothetical protein n=1 Tax=Streptomyces sp. NBC_01408 TaxID=2903855 RepID=UPI00224F8717|nr:hypothetical protein [Streptomyces sp. NBC_01408]MCX4693280.1 hypothetical protein [Streptomyces sp. NBC_01408]